jgi:hypothetical protein
VTFDFFIEYFSAIFCLMPVFACSCQRGASQLEAAFAGYGAPEALMHIPRTATATTCPAEALAKEEGLA